MIPLLWFIVVDMESMSVRIKKDTIEELKRLKVHYRETYDDVIKRLIEAWKGRTRSQ